MTFKEFLAMYAVQSDDLTHTEVIELYKYNVVTFLRGSFLSLRHFSPDCKTLPRIYQDALPFYLQALREEKEGESELFVPVIDPVSDGGVPVQLWSDDGIATKPCRENIALILKVADKPGKVVREAGFKNLSECVAWALTLPSARQPDGNK